MQRRTLLKQFLYVTGGVLLIPSCMQDKNKASILLKRIQIDSDQEKLMAELTETLIPATDTPGAKDISAHLFVMMMIDDCYTKEEQQRFMQGLNAFSEETKKQFDKRFTDCTTTEKNKLLSQLDKNKAGSTELNYFYATVKKLTIQAYTSSKYFLTKVQVYELVPGRYNGCVPVKSIS